VRPAPRAQRPAPRAPRPAPPPPLTARRPRPPLRAQRARRSARAVARFEEFRDKIVHVVLDSLPDAADPWVRERAQRDGIHEGLAQVGERTPAPAALLRTKRFVRGAPQAGGDARGARAQAAAEGEDLVLISDADEIPRRSTARALAWCAGFTPPLQLRSAFYYYSFRHRWAEDAPDGPRPFQWRHPRAAAAAQLPFPRVTANHLRYDPGDSGSMQVPAIRPRRLRLHAGARPRAARRAAAGGAVWAAAAGTRISHPRVAAPVV